MQSATVSATPLVEKPGGVRLLSQKALHGFHRDSNGSLESATKGRSYILKAAASNTAKAPMAKKLRNRHLQMIAIGGSIGTGLFIGSGQALAVGGPASLLIAFILIGLVVYCTVQALGEMAVVFPVAGSFSAFSTRFCDPAWGFAMGWNYAMQWLIVLPLEVMAASLTLQFWNPSLPTGVFITIFLVAIVSINLFGIKAFGESEYFFSTIKVAAVIGFIILGIIINCAGGQNTGYIGGLYWQNPGPFNNGFKGLCTVMVTAAFAFAGTELVGLAAAETHNPTKSIPTAVKQVFWRIALFYVLSMAIVGLLVPYNHPSLITRSSVDSKASPFVIAISEAGIKGLDSVMNVVIMISVLSVANSSLFGSSRTLAALAQQGQAPKILGYIDKNGRPIVSIGVAASISLLSYLSLSDISGQTFTWLLALSGLSCIFTWASICLAHIRFRQAWKAQGHSLNELIYKSSVGVVGSWIGFVSLMIVLIVQLWVAIDPIGGGSLSVSDRVAEFFSVYLAMPIVLLFYGVYKIYYRTPWIRIQDIDLDSGKNNIDPLLFIKVKEDKASWPMWKVVYKSLC